MQILHNTLSKYKPTAIYNLGKKWFAFNRMEMPSTELLKKMQ